MTIAEIAAQMGVTPETLVQEVIARECDRLDCMENRAGNHGEPVYCRTLWRWTGMIDLHKLDKFRLKDREREFYGCTGDSGNGVFKVYVGGKSFRVIASNGMGWEHVSVSPGSAQRKCCPTWDEMCAIKDMFFGEDERVMQFHPPKSEYINNHPYCLHLWRPVDTEIPHPPMICV